MTERIIEKNGRKYKEIPVRSAYPIWGATAVWVLAAIAVPMYALWQILAVALASVLAYLLIARLCPKQTRLVELPFTTGNGDLDETVRRIHGALDTLSEAASACRESAPSVAERVARIRDTIEKIRDTVVEDPRDLPLIRRFLSYYLPTTEKLVTKYNALTAHGADGETIRETKAAIEGALAQIEQAFRCQLDALYRDDALDISTDITVLETMLARDNLQ